MAPAGRDVRERCPWRQTEQPALRVELLEQGIEVALVDAASVKQDQRAAGFASWFASQMDQLDDLARALGRRIRR
jgi:hypothetical protein